MTTSEAVPIDGFASVEAGIVRACRDARRERSTVTLVAVSKTFDVGRD